MYKLIKSSATEQIVSVLKTNENGQVMSIPFDPANSDYQSYLKWVSEGNTPEQAD